VRPIATITRFIVAPSDIARAAPGGAIAAGVSGVRLQNPNGVILPLRGAKLGVELSASVACISITME
jgi:hypothetical protein